MRARSRTQNQRRTSAAGRCQTKITISSTPGHQARALTRASRQWHRPRETLPRNVPSASLLNKVPEANQRPLGTVERWTDAFNANSTYLSQETFGQQGRSRSREPHAGQWLYNRTAHSRITTATASADVHLLIPAPKKRRLSSIRA